MYCKGCGKELKNDTNFCMHCGLSQVEKPASVEKRKPVLFMVLCILIVILIFVIVVMVLMRTKNKKEAMTNTDFLEKTVIFDSPEAAIIHYFEKIAENDIEGALQACAVQECENKYDFKKQAIRNQSLMPLSVSYSPNKYDMYRIRNRIKMENYFANIIVSVCYSLTTDAPVIHGETMLFSNEAEVDRFIAEVNPEQLKDLKVMRIDYSCPSKQNSEQNQENFQINAATWGADEMREYVVLLELQNRYYMAGYSVNRYGEGWKINGTAPLTGMSGSGEVEAISEDDYAEYLE